MTSVATLAVEDGIGILTIDYPPVNALGVAVRRGLDEGFRTFDADPAVKAIILICAGRTFFAGADIAELGKPIAKPDLGAVFDILDHGSKPVIAAIHGTALGGGYELALACHHRIAVPSSKVGLPEVKLGLLPGAGGTQRLPRIVGAAVALDLISSGRPVSAPEALGLGMIDALAAEGSLRKDAIAFARGLVDAARPSQRVRDRDDKLVPARENPGLFDAFLARNGRAFRGLKAPASIVEAVRAAVTLPFDEGMKREAELLGPLMASTESQAQRYAFFAERETGKIPDIPSANPTLPIARVGVIGAGTMGGGIAMNFLNAGLPVTIVETAQDALDRGMATIRRNYEATARKGRLTASEVEERMALLSPTLDMAALGEADLVIEAVYESMEVKRAVFARLDAIARPGAILASNTSFLDLDAIAAVTARPDRVIGMHFFSPANVMRLLEVVRGAKTDPAVVATAMKLARTIGKVPVLARVCHGFIANRLMTPRGEQAEALLLEGPTAEAIDRVMTDYGFPMGPFQLDDLVGLDVLGRDATERTLRGDLVALGRLGQKGGGGFYDYDAQRNVTPSPVAAAAVADFRRFKGIADDGAQGADAILARLLYPVVNEAAKILEEGIALRASDIDIAAILGYGWPVQTGGPMFWADTVGLPAIVAKLRDYEAAYGEAFRPAALLARLAAEGGRFTPA
ncbi:3-hydroxyacyl-CoA dehydrogenase NAD-binding domain-containing protein [Sphingomonas bacterium]|uniref:3-hydroxyacyl-CoA dehydrogenase NAD-binding domain-containing protein n=1 Tax=Sphingomonas bacterium TaxID=1895847 RepID=UPI00157570A3|nr:3-hydroxyacyl-CoA dehydrogenase NAD-binding domain-containing protein [Sphingomonas bacterium]